MTDSSFGWNIIKRPEVKKPTIHIVVKDGLVQEVYAEDVEVEVFLYDLDGEEDLSYEVADLKKTATQVY